MPTARAPTGSRRKGAPSVVRPDGCALAGRAANDASTAETLSLKRRGLIDEHHGDVIVHRITKAARVTHE
jgi:hypothetical protein